MNRKLASIQRVVDVVKHPNADTLDLITVLGWQVVNKSGQLAVGDLCVFFEIDAVLPPIPEFAFLEKVKYRIKTCKLRGAVSQGLVMPLSILETIKSPNWQYIPETNPLLGEKCGHQCRTLAGLHTCTLRKGHPFCHQEYGDLSAPNASWGNDHGKYQKSPNTLIHREYDVSAPSVEAGEPTATSVVNIPIAEGLDVTDALGVVKHDPDKQGTFRLSSQAKGRFPEWLKKTDAERFQSVGQAAIEEFHDKVFGYSLKMNGTSFTAYLKDGEFGVCSRNLDLKKVEPKESLYWLIAEKYDLESRLRAFVQENTWGIKNIAIQGEILGPSVQKNNLKLLEPELQVFDVFDIDKQEYVCYDDEVFITKQLGLKHVEILGFTFVFDKAVHNVDFFLKLASGNYEGTENPKEGLVFKSIGSLYSNALRDRMKFKIINNEYLLKNDE